ncbi:MAG: glycosyltransferase [Bacteroidales bacterium]|nr:glycosyltransferase [Bacteroidales bacterium]
MKIAILSCFYPFRGGVAQFNASMLGELSRSCTVKAFNFTVQYPDFLFPGKTQFVQEGDTAVPVESEALLSTVNPFSWYKTAKAIREWGADVLVLRYWMSWFAPSLGTVARHAGKNCKVVAIMDNVIPHEPHFFDKPLTRWFLKAVDGCITMSDEVAADLLRWKPDARHVTLPHPLYTHFGERVPREEAMQALGLDPGLKTLLFFGLIRKYKGLDILLEAFSGLSEDYQLLIAGEPYGEFGEYEEAIDKSPNRDRIKLFDKYIPDSAVKTYFSAADVVVLPYRSATQSGVGALADQFEVPMIVTDTGSLRRTVEGRGTGLVVDKAEPELVKEGIERFFGTPGLQEGCIARIREVKKRLSWSEFCKGLTRFTESL